MTTGTEITLRGKGLHTGLSSTVEIRRRGDSDGIRFYWPGWEKPLVPADLISLHRQARRATILKGWEGQEFRTPEHLLAAALFFADKPLDVICSAQEPPGLDGSAEPFYMALSEAANPSGWREYASELRWDYEGPEGKLSASPSDHFSVEYEWEVWRTELPDAETAVEGILPARTFILYREWLTMKDAGDLLAGTDAGSGLLLAESPDGFEAALQAHPEFQGRAFPLLHPGSFRMDLEPVRHKILDLLGDLALMGLALPKLRLEIRNGGHALNHRLLEQLQHERRQRLNP
jgi:UDP-3-O-acyl-N-acetylglucosamine deacetylase